MCASTPLICSKSVLPEVFLAKRRNNLRFLFRVPLWFFSAFVGAAQRSASSPPKAAARASTSVAPPIRVLRVFPKTFHAFPSTLPVARLPRVPFSVAVEGLRLRRCTLCFLFSRGGLAAPFAILKS